MTPADAARLVITEQAFAVGGGKSDTGNTTHAPLVSGAIVLVRGQTLFETLWLNLTIFGERKPVASLETDAPVWERPTGTPHSEAARPKGYLDYLTWQSRTLRLIPEVESDRIVVRRVYYAQGRKLDIPAAFYDPMMAYAGAARRMAIARFASTSFATSGATVHRSSNSARRLNLRGRRRFTLCRPPNWATSCRGRRDTRFLFSASAPTKRK